MAEAVGRQSASSAFDEQQDWQERTYKEVALAIGEELIKRGNLHHQICKLGMLDLTRCAYAAVGKYAELHEARRQELLARGEDAFDRDYIGA